MAAGASGRLASGRELSRRQVRDYYNRGGLLKTARGHATRERPVRIQAPREPLARLNAGRATSEDRRVLEDWQKNQAPAYLRSESLWGVDTAAALARVPLNPANWARVDMYTRRDGTVAVYITSRKGRQYSTTLPDVTSGLELRDYVVLSSRRRLQSGGAGGAKRASGARFLAEDLPPIDDVDWETP